MTKGEPRGVDDNPGIDSFLTSRGQFVIAAREPAVTRDEKDFQVFRVGAPLQSSQGGPNRPDVVICGVVAGSQHIEPAENRIIIYCEGCENLRVRISQGVFGAALSEDRQLHYGRLSVFGGEEHFIDDGPDFSFCLVNESGHTPAGVQHNGNLDKGPSSPGRRDGRNVPAVHGPSF